MEAPRQVRVEVERPRCPYCHEAIEVEGRKTGCERCLAWHHKECWDEHGGCSGCGQLPVEGGPGGAAIPIRVEPPRPVAVEPERPEPGAFQPWRESERLSTHERVFWASVLAGLIGTLSMLALLGLLIASMS